MSNDVRNTYQQIEVSTPNNLHLVVMLYEGAIRFLNDAKVSIRNRNVPGKVLAVDRVLAIIGELQATLRMEEGGHIASALDRLYAYMIGRILDASAQMDTAPLDEVTKLLNVLNSAWTEIAEQSRKQAAAAGDTKPSEPLGPSTPQQSLKIIG
jgi:flagellar protein FliS